MGRQKNRVESNVVRPFFTGNCAMRKLLLWALIAVPTLYYFALLLGAAIYPGYSHVTRYASELGAAGAPHPELFNYSIMLAGVACIVGAAGLVWSIQRLQGRRGWTAAAAVSIVCWGAGLIVGGAFPMPDERHGAFGIGLVGILAPLFVLLALRGVKNASPVLWFLAFVFVGSCIVLSIMFGAGGLVTPQNVGIWQRIFSAFSMVWLAVIAAWLLVARAPEK
jgi:hypothetical membrane protein